jgi:hypothetical protein
MQVIIGVYCKSDKLIITIPFLVSLLRVGLILFLVVVLRNANTRYHSRHERGQAFNVKDLVLCLVQRNKDRHKLSPPWEGPYIVAKVL